MKRYAPSIAAVLGAQGAGKTRYTKCHLLPTGARSRLLVWDYKGEYTDVADRCAKIGDVVKRVKAGRSFRLLFVPDRDTVKRAAEFTDFCDIAMALGDVTLVVDELAFVTRPSYAPDAWKAVTCLGRDRGVRVVGCAQRPAQIDKDFLGNASMIHCGTMGDVDDAKAAAARLPDVDWRRLLDLPYLDFIERDKISRTMLYGSLDPVTGKVKTRSLAGCTSKKPEK